MFVVCQLNKKYMVLLGASLLDLSVAAITKVES